MNPRNEIYNIINNQKTVSTKRLRVLFDAYKEQQRKRIQRYRDRTKRLEEKIKNQRRELRRLRGH